MIIFILYTKQIISRVLVFLVQYCESRPFKTVSDFSEHSDPDPGKYFFVLQ